MRLLKFISVFLGTTVIVFGLVLGLNWNTFMIFIDNRASLTEGSEWIFKTHSLRGLSEYIGENPDRNSFSRIITGDHVAEVHFMENERRTLGSLSNLLLFFAYSKQYQSGDFSGEETLLWDDINRHQLPGIGESAHRESFRQANRRGWIVDGVIELNNALLLLSEFNSEALADYLWWLIDPDIWETLPVKLNLTKTDMPLPFSGLHLTLSPAVQFMEIDSLLSHYESILNDEWRQLVTETAEKYVVDESFRLHASEVMGKDGTGLTFMQQRDLLRKFPKGTSRELASLLSDLLSDQIPFQYSRDHLLQWLQWPVRGSSLLGRDIKDSGALYDSRIGLLAGINFGTSLYTEEQSVQVLLMDNLPVGFWFHASGGHMHQDLLQRLIYDPAMMEQMEFITRLHQN